ncbi:MAG: hypothetical protein K2F97_08625, partial [Muribaculaceae bacterium]|nr:hypothetical protein [Muribaculaceae bacterium]
MKKWLIPAGVLATLVLGAYIAARTMLLAPYDGKTAARVYIPADATPESMADSLRSAFGPSYGGKVARLLRWSGTDPSAAHGSYLVRPGTSAMRLSRNISKRRQTPVRFTFNNVRTLNQLADRAGARMEFSAEDFLAACDSML